VILSYKSSKAGLTPSVDNAAMIAWAAFERYKLKKWDTFDAPLLPEWNIEQCDEIGAT
jgi:tRNA A37 threonylcarbamoyltransferase TsaD